MSYNLPGQNGGFVRTDPPSTPCTGDFVEKLNCTEHGFFFWIGAFCVLVVVLGLCSCYVVTPLFRWYRARHAPASDPTADIEGKGRTKKTPSKKSHHWYLNDVLRIDPDDEKEYGPRTSRASRAPSHGSISRDSTGSFNPHDVAAAAVAAQALEEPGIGATATASGGGWMGAANGRL